jgi:hypothetical protein
MTEPMRAGLPPKLVLKRAKAFNLAVPEIDELMKPGPPVTLNSTQAASLRATKVTKTPPSTVMI